MTDDGTCLSLNTGLIDVIVFRISREDELVRGKKGGYLTTSRTLLIVMETSTKVFPRPLAGLIVFYATLLLNNPKIPFNAYDFELLWIFPAETFKNVTVIR